MESSVCHSTLLLCCLPVSTGIRELLRVFNRLIMIELAFLPRAFELDTEYAARQRQSGTEIKLVSS